MDNVNGVSPLKSINADGKSYRNEVERDVFHALQEESSLIAYSTMFGRMLCSVIRTKDEYESWATAYPFDTAQITAIDAMLAAIELYDEEDDRLIDAIHTLCVSLICRERDEFIDEEDFVFPLYRFLVLACIDESDKFMHVKRIPPVIAQLQWCCRATVYREIMIRIKSHRNSKVIEELCRYVQINHNTPFNSIRQATHLASSIAGTGTGLGQTVWLGKGHEKIAINGKAVSLLELRAFLKSRIKMAKDMLEEELLCGIKIDEFGCRSGNIIDKLNDLTEGYSFIHNKLNGFEKHKTTLLEKIEEDPRIAKQFIRRRDKLSIEWNLKGCERWLKKTRRFLQILCVIMHLSYGQPARGTELEIIRILNGPDGDRGLYWIDPLVMVLGTYSKTRQISGRDRLIPRFLPKVVGDLLIKYLALVRPMEIRLAKKVEGGTAEFLKEFLFADYKKMWSSDQISDALKLETNRGMSVSLGIREYRHVATAFMEEHLKYHKINLDASHIFDLQAGHLSKTAAREYAVGMDDHGEVTRDMMYAYGMASREWHQLMGVGDEETNECLGTETAVTPASTTPASATPASTANISSMIEEAVMRAVAAITKPAEDVSTMIEQKIARILDGRQGGPGIPLQPLEINSQLSTQPIMGKISSAKLLSTLRSFQKDQNARFKSEEQRRGVEAVLNRQKDVLVILPTGGGKTLVYLLPTLLEKGRTTVVVIPMIAVMQDLIDRCNKSNISVAEWSSASTTMSTTASLLLVSVEQATESSFHNHLHALHDSRRLSRIVLDECHTPLTQGSFRLCMQDLVDRWAVDVPLLLLTATGPPFMETRLRDALGCRSSLEVIRARTRRQEISYEVIEMENDEKEEDLEIEISSRVRAKLAGLKNKADRGLVYCLTKEWAERLKNQINEDEGDTIAEVYHSQMSREVREGIYRDWKKGKFKVLVATSALGMGVDYAHVRFVFHQGQSHSLMDFSQESGRAGRDGKRAESIVVTSKRFRRDCEWMKEKGGAEWQSMEDWVEGKVCRKWMLGEYMDGVGKGVSCLDGGDCGLCDICSGQMAEAGGMTMEWELPTVGESVRTNVSTSRMDGRERTDVAMRIKELIDEMRGRCALCWSHGRREKHELHHCGYAYGHCLRCLDKGHKIRDCVKINFPRGKACFRCGFPQKLGGQHIHGEVRTGTCEPGLEDTVGPVCWSSWRDSQTRARMEREFGRTWTVDEFREWMGRVESKGVTNGVLLLLWLWEERE